MASVQFLWQYQDTITVQQLTFTSSMTFTGRAATRARGHVLTRYNVATEVSCGRTYLRYSNRFDSNLTIAIFHVSVIKQSYFSSGDWCDKVYQNN